MESHRCEKTRGEGVPFADPVPNLHAQSSLVDAGEALLCQYIDGRGHRCRMPVISAPSQLLSADGPVSDTSTAGLCTYHAQRLLQRQRASETAAAELLACVSDFSDAASVNRFLGNLIKQVALKRIPRRDGIALAYISQLLLNSLGAMDRKEVLRLEQLRLEALRKKNLPPRIVWDIPVGPNAPGRQASPKPSENPDRKMP